MPAAKLKTLNNFQSTRRQAVTVTFDLKEKKTEQSHARSCDINTIMARYNKTGIIDHVAKHSATYADVSNADFQTAQSLVLEQKTIFEELPAFVRDEFDNDVGNYLELMQTDEGLSELQSILHPTDTHEELETLATEQITDANEQSDTNPESETEKPVTST